MGKSAKTSVAKAEMLNSFFGPCFNTSTPPLSTNDVANLVSNSSEDLLCSPSEILGLINTLDAQKASGPDGISVNMLKATAVSIAPSIAKLFNISIRLARFPQSWKISSIVPVPKTKKQLGDASNYRPISLLSVVSKLLERHLHLLLVDYLNETCPLSNKQWGFQHGKSTTTALLYVIDQWFQLLEKGQEVCAVFFDLRKAFDTVPHRPLLDKLHSFGIDPNLISWICSYLTERKQHVIYDGVLSNGIPVLSGVPQGSVLGPLLFLIYIDDVTSVHLSQDSMLNLFADDMLLFKPITSVSDFHHLQDDIESIKNWTDSNHLSLNTKKCKCMLVSRKSGPRQPLSFKLGGDVLEQVKTFKYLGVLIFSSLSWSPHVEAVCMIALRQESCLVWFTEDFMV